MKKILLIISTISLFVFGFICGRYYYGFDRFLIDMSVQRALGRFDHLSREECNDKIRKARVKEFMDSLKWIEKLDCRRPKEPITIGPETDENRL